MRTKSPMDYIYSDENEEILIEHIQAQTRSTVIAQYRQCRKEKKMTQAELAKRTGISQPNINRFESGNYNPSLEMLVRIASALDMEVCIQLREKGGLCADTAQS